MGRKEKSILITLAILSSIIPPIAFYFFSHAPTLHPQEAKELLIKEPSKTVLLDVQETHGFDRMHIQGSIHIPYDVLLQGNIHNEPISRMQGKTD